MNCGGAGRGNIDNAGVGQGVLKAQSGAALLRGGDVATLALSPASILHGVAFVENHDPVEIGAKPFHDLFDPRDLLATIVRAQRRVGREHYAFRQRDLLALREARERSDQQALHAERRPIALGRLRSACRIC